MNKLEHLKRKNQNNLLLLPSTDPLFVLQGVEWALPKFSMSLPSPSLQANSLPYSFCTSATPFWFFHFLGHLLLFFTLLCFPLAWFLFFSKRFTKWGLWMSGFRISWGLTRPTRAVFWEWRGAAEGSACCSSTPRHSLAHWSSGYVALMHQAQFLTLLHMLDPFPWGVQMWAEFSLLWLPEAPLYLWPLIWCWIFYFQVFTGVFPVLAVTTRTCHLLAQAPQ